MKAKEYYAKYGERLMDPKETQGAIMELFKDFSAEYKEITERRKVSTAKGNLLVLEELNDKWNAIARMFPTEVLKRNGYRDFWLKQLNVPPEAATAIMKRRGL